MQFRSATCAFTLLLLAGCAQQTGLSPSDPAFKMLADGRYRDARKPLEARLAADPGNAYIQFDLASDYWDLGRMDLAAPLYREVIKSGKDIMPTTASGREESGMTLSDMACTALRRGLQDNYAC
jgi:tetratricopeptide (TPR) repeat protein